MLRSGPVGICEGHDIQRARPDVLNLAVYTVETVREQRQQARILLVADALRDREVCLLPGKVRSAERVVDCRLELW